MVQNPYRERPEINIETPEQERARLKRERLEKKHQRWEQEARQRNAEIIRRAEETASFVERILGVRVEKFLTAEDIEKEEVEIREKMEKYRREDDLEGFISAIIHGELAQKYPAAKLRLIIMSSRKLKGLTKKALQYIGRCWACGDVLYIYKKLTSGILSPDDKKIFHGFIMVISKRIKENAKDTYGIKFKSVRELENYIKNHPFPRKHGSYPAWITLLGVYRKLASGRN